MNEQRPATEPPRGPAGLPLPVLLVAGGALGAAVGSGGGGSATGLVAGLLIGVGVGAGISYLAGRRGRP